jgi:glutamine synthetase
VSIAPKLVAPGFNLEEDFGIYVFGDDKMKSRLNAEMYKRYKVARETRSPIPTDVAESVAHAMKEWAMSHGATHFTHWCVSLSCFFAILSVSAH